MTDGSDSAWPYPWNDKPLGLPSGTTVQFYDLIVVRGSGERSAKSFSVHYRTEIDRNDHSARQAEAKEVIRHFESASFLNDARKAHASICSTPAQAATKERPEEIFQFERGPDGEWEFVGMAEPASRTA